MDLPVIIVMLSSFYSKFIIICFVFLLFFLFIYFFILFFFCFYFEIIIFLLEIIFIIKNFFPFKILLDNYLRNKLNRSNKLFLYF